MNLSAAMFLYPWDALAQGTACVLDRLAVSGLNGAKLASAYHSGKVLSTASRSVVVPEDGAIYFHPDARFYRDCDLRPPVSSLVAKRDPLGELCDAAGRRGMFADAWIVCLHNRAIGDAAPEVCTRNAFGNAYPHSLCPLQPRVAAYLEALVAQLCAYTIRRVALEAWQYVPYRHYSLCEIEGVPVGPYEKLLLSLCFCDACRSKIPQLVELQPVVCAQLIDFLRTGLPCQGEKLDAAMAGLAPLLQRRAVANAALVEHLASQACKQSKTVSLLTGPLEHGPAPDALALAAPYAAAAELAYYQSSAEGLAGCVRDVQSVLPQSCRTAVALRPGFPDTDGSENLSAKVHYARQCGVCEFGFYNYGTLPETALEYVARALHIGS